MADGDPSLPRGFSIYQKLDDGIYECEPRGVLHLEHNYPFWIIASLDLNTKLQNSDLEDVRDFKPIIRKDDHYTATANGKPIIAIKQEEFIKYFGDEYDDFGIVVPRTIPTSEKNRQDVARSVNIEHLTTPGARRGRNIALTSISNRRTPRDLSPGQPINFSSYRDSPIRDQIKKIVEDIPPTIPHFKKKKNSLKKSKKSIKCKKTPYAWKSSSIKKSPFRKLERAKDAERQYKAGKSIGFTAISSLKSLGRIPRSDGCYVLGAKYSALKHH